MNHGQAIGFRDTECTNNKKRKSGHQHDFLTEFIDQYSAKGFAYCSKQKVKLAMAPISALLTLSKDA